MLPKLLMCITVIIVLFGRQVPQCYGNGMDMVGR